MKTELDDAYTWFLEHFRQDVDGVVTIRLAEGIKQQERKPVDVGVGEPLGPYFPVEVTETSRCVEVCFHEVFAVLVFDESCSGSDREVVKEIAGRYRLSRVADSAFQRFVKATTTAFATPTPPVCEFQLWTEDRIFQLIAADQVHIRNVPEGPDRGIEHVQTWAAS